MLFWIELVQHRANDRCAKRLQLIFCSAHLIAIGASRADDQKDPVWEKDRNAVRALDQSTPGRNPGDFRPADMTLSDPGSGASSNSLTR